jgi:hypothetical protein
VNVSCRELVPIIEAALTTGARVRLTATGSSMIPSIRNGETVELESVAFGAIVRGDVIMARRPDGVYVMHRVADLGNGRAYLVSDAGRHDGWIESGQIVARAAAVLRRGRVHALNSRRARCMGLLWLRLGVAGTRALGLYLGLRRRIGPGARKAECRRRTA